MNTGGWGRVHQRTESQARGCRGIPYGVPHQLQYGDLAGREAPRRKKKSIHYQGIKMTFQEKEESPFSSNNNNLCKGLSPDKEELERTKVLPWRSPFPQRRKESQLNEIPVLPNRKVRGVSVEAALTLVDWDPESVSSIFRDWVPVQLSRHMEWSRGTIPCHKLRDSEEGASQSLCSLGTAFFKF